MKFPRDSTARPPNKHCETEIAPPPLVIYAQDWTGKNCSIFTCVCVKFCAREKYKYFIRIHCHVFVVIIILSSQWQLHMYNVNILQCTCLNNMIFFSFKTIHNIHTNRKTDKIFLTLFAHDIKIKRYVKIVMMVYLTFLLIKYTQYCQQIMIDYYYY